MVNLKEAETTKAKVLYMLAIIIAAIGFPLYFVQGFEIQNIEINSKTIFISFLYVVFVVGFIFLLFNVKGKNVTSTETDQKFVKGYEKFSKIALKIILLYIAGQLIWLTYVAISKQ